jgi:hypothetical protein
MPTPRSSVRQEQLRLFQPRPNRPQWQMFSKEIREEAITLLAKMFLTYQTLPATPKQGEEVSDE